MLRLQRSQATSHNETLEKILRKKGQNNAQYVAAHGAQGKDHTTLVLIGGVGAVDFRLRVAQAHARDDLAPSAFSHAFLMGAAAKSAAKTTVYEVSLYGRAGIGYPPATNGVATALLGEYADVTHYPNIAVLRIPVPAKAVIAAVERFQHQRSTMDALEHQLAWWAFVWGVGRAPNPLLEGIGIPSAAFSEYVLSSVGYDLVPGFPSRSSCPEAIWQSARWWFEMPRRQLEAGEGDGKNRHAIAGAFDAEQYLVPTT